VTVGRQAAELAEEARHRQRTLLARSLAAQVLSVRHGMPASRSRLTGFPDAGFRQLGVSPPAIRQPGFAVGRMPSYQGRMPGMIRWIAIAIAVAVLAFGASVWLFPDGRVGKAIESATGVAVPGGVQVGGPFALVDQTGVPVTDATYRGRWKLVYFGYTFCPDVCPTELQAVASALELLGPLASRVVPIFVTVDPERDTPAHLADYVKLFDDRLVGLTGTPEQIAAVTRAYRVYYAKVTPKESTTYLMDHSSFLYLMGPDGMLRALIRPGSSPQDIADTIKARMAAAS
jgi:protein SCO1/2